MLEKIKDKAKDFFIYIIFMLISSFGISLIWNFLMPNMFKLKEISVSEAFLLIFLISLIFSSVLISIFFFFNDCIEEETIEIIIIKDEEKKLI